MEVLKLKKIVPKEEQRDPFSNMIFSPPTSTPKKKMEMSLPIDLDLTKPEAEVIIEEEDEAEVKKSGKSDAGNSRGSLSSSKQDWLAVLDRSFIDKVVGGLESSMRSQVSTNIQNGKKLTPKQNKSVIGSVNHEIFKFIGNQRPDANLCRYFRT